MDLLEDLVGIHFKSNQLIICRYALGCQSRNGAAAKAQMQQQITSSVTAGGSLALVFKLLSWADRQAPLPAFCEALTPGWQLDYPSFCLGITFGVFLYLVVEAAVTLRWAFVHWFGSRTPYIQKPLYKILHEQ